MRHAGHHTSGVLQALSPMARAFGLVTRGADAQDGGGGSVELGEGVMTGWGRQRWLELVFCKKLDRVILQQEAPDNT